MPDAGSSVAQRPPRPLAALTGFTLTVLLPSAAIVQKYVGPIGVAVYLGLAIAASWYWRRTVGKVIGGLTDRQLYGAAVAIFIVLAAVFALAYPIANAGLLGRGSDRDEALNAATAALLRGQYPYSARTYLGNPPGTMPGALILAAPFVLLGNSAYQNLAWLWVFGIAASLALRSRRLALSLLLATIVLSPEVLQEYVTGGDLLANSIYVPLGVMGLIAVAGRKASRQWPSAGMAVLLGLALASRANFALVLPLVFSTLARAAGLTAALKWVALAAITAGLLVAPFYLHDVHGFSPAYTANKFSQFAGWWPAAGRILPIVSAVFAAGVAAYQRSTSVPGVCRSCAIVLMFPVLTGIVLDHLVTGRPEFEFAAFGLSAVFFGALGFGPALISGAGAAPQAA